MRNEVLQRIRTVGVVVLILSVIPAAAAAGRQLLHGHVPAAISRLQPVGSLPTGEQLDLDIGLPLRNQEALTNLLRQMYDPASTNFHRYLAPGQFAERFGPTEKDYRALIDFAQTNGLRVTGICSNRTLLTLRGSVADIERIFHVTLRTYRHPSEARNFFAPDTEPAIDLDVPVLHVSGLDNFIVPRPLIHAIPITGVVTSGRPGTSGGSPLAGSGSGSGGLFLGTDFRNAYVPGITLTGAGQTVGLFELDGYTPSDITAYEATPNPHLPNVPLVNILLDGVTNHAGNENGEVALDIEMLIAMAPGLSQISVYEGTTANHILAEMASPSKGEPLPLQISSSWTFAVDTNTTQALDAFALQGQSFFQASGDYGAYASDPKDIRDENNVTVVGGTELTMSGSGASWVSESSWNVPSEAPKDATGGGILSGVSIPSYQQGIDMSARGGSSQYRNVPDVAMVADNILIVATATNVPQVPGTVFVAWGTSASAPLWAGFAALINQKDAADGRPALGFVNPTLYVIAKGAGYGSDFHDVQTGNNTNGVSPGAFYAVAGYDLCTGWGSPNSSLISALENFTGAVWVDFSVAGPGIGTYDDPYNTLALGVANVAAGGTVAIKGPNSTPVTPTISKPLTLNASGGPVTIGK